MQRTNRVVLVGGSRPASLIKPEKLYTDSAVQQWIQRFQPLLDHHTQDVEEGPVNLQSFCTDRKELHPRHELVATHALTAISAFARWEQLFPELLETQGRKGKLTHTAFLGHSFGLWIAAFLADLYDEETAMRLVIERAKTAWLPDVQSLVVTPAKNDPRPIRLSDVQGVCGFAQYAWISVVNQDQQILVTGTAPCIAQIQAALQIFRVEARLYSNGTAWHTPLLTQAQKKLARRFHSLKRPNKLELPILLLDRRGKLRTTKDPARTIDAMLAELTEPFHFPTRVLQLPEGLQFHEISTTPHVQKIVEQIRGHAEKHSAPPAPMRHARTVLTHQT